MHHEGEQIRKEIERLQRKLEQQINNNQRQGIQSAINHLKQKKKNWERPH